MYQQFLEDRITRLENLFYSTIKLISEPNIKYAAQLETKLIQGITDENGEAEITLPRLGDWEITIEDPAIGKRTRIIEANQLGTVFEVEIKFATLTIKTDEGNLVIATNGNYAISRLIDESETCSFKIGDGDWNIKYSNRVFYEIEQIRVKSTDSKIELNFRAPAINISTTCDIDIKITGGGKVIKDKVGAGETYKFQAVYGAWQVEVKSEYGEEETYQAVLSKTSGTLDIDFVSQYRVYGAKWDGDLSVSTRWKRTDMATNFSDPVPYVTGMSSSQCNSPFDNVMPWSGMEKLSMIDGNIFVKIPKFWYKLAPYGDGGLKIQISDQSLKDFQVSPAHMDRGDGYGERDVIYIGRYHCASDYRSKVGSPKTGVVLKTARTAVQKIDFTSSKDHLYLTDFLTRFTIYLLYLVEYAEWSSQRAIGLGVSSKSSTMTMGYTDSMPYHTGATVKNEFGGTQYRNIEGLWDNCFDVLEGNYFDYYSNLHLILNPKNFGDATQGTLIGDLKTGGWPIKYTIKNINNKFQVFVPSKYTSGWSSGLNSCDYWSNQNNQSNDAMNYYLCAGSGYKEKRDTSSGIFQLETNTYSNMVAGARLMYLP